MNESLDLFVLLLGDVTVENSLRVENFAIQENRHGFFSFLFFGQSIEWEMKTCAGR
jgi:hypothetical protein